MMNAEQMTTHLSSEQIAAFVDGRLREQERRESESHFASCDECREVFLAVSDAVEEGVTGEKPLKFVPRPRPQKWAAVAALAAAAAVGVFFLPPVQNKIEDRRTGGISKLVRAVEDSKEPRIVAGRLDGGFPYRDLKRINRGVEDLGGNERREGDDFQDWIVLKAAWEVEKDNPTTVKDLRATAISRLIRGHKHEAVPLLEKAVSLDPDNAALLSDLAAAYIAVSDDNRALNAADRAWAMQKTPQTAWNRALAHDEVSDSPSVIALWEDYLHLDPNSAWSTEASKKINDLRNPL